MVVEGQLAGVLFVCQRPNAQKFSPMYERDPKFATALERAYQSGVKIWCITTKITLDSMTYFQEILVAFNQ